MAGSAAIAITATGGMVGIGTLSGAASFSIEATGAAGDDADLAGSATIAVAATGSLSGIARSSGVATFSIGAVGAASGGEEPTTTNPWGISWGNSWGSAWGFLVGPYAELSLKGQVFVRSYLSSIHSVEVAERIVSVAALNNISVVDAEVVVAAKTGEARLEAVKKRTPSRIPPPEQVKQPERKKTTELRVKQSQLAVFVEQRGRSISAETMQAVLVAYSNTVRVDLINYVN